MHGALWIFSYIFLAASVIWLTLAVIALYRSPASHAGLAHARNTWPSATLVPGDPLPAIQGVSLLGDLVSIDSSVPDAVLIFARAADRLAYAALVSVKTLAPFAAGELQLCLVVMMSSGEERPSWLSECASFCQLVALVNAADTRSIALTATPTAAVVLDGRVKHMAAGITTPTDARDRLGVFLLSRASRARVEVQRTPVELEGNV